MRSGNFEQTLSIDPEDLQAHYNLCSLTKRGPRRRRKGNEHKAPYLRFQGPTNRRQAITGPYPPRRIPKITIERQAIHDTSASR